MSLGSLPEPLIPVELSNTLPELNECHRILLLPTHRSELQSYTRCLRKLKRISDTNYRMLLCLIAFLATYAELARASERPPSRRLWIQRAASAYTLSSIIPREPVLPTMCLLVANARHFLSIESGQPISDSDWVSIVHQGRTTSDLLTGLESNRRKLVRRQNVMDRDVPERPRLAKRESRSFMKITADAWKGRKKKSGD